MEANNNQNSSVNKENVDQSRTYLKTVSELTEKLGQAISDGINSIEISNDDEKALVIQLHKAPAQQDSNRSSTSKAISLVNCHCSCHDEGRVENVVRYELLEEESKPQPRILVEEPTPSPSSIDSHVTESAMSHVSKMTQMTQMSQATQLGQESKTTTGEPSIKESAVSSPSTNVLLDKLSQSKFCEKCGKLRKSWVFTEKDKFIEIKSVKSEEYPSETEIVKEDLISVQTGKSAETIDSKNDSISASVKSEATGVIESSLVTESIACHQECKMHCPKNHEIEPPVEKQPVQTASDNLSQSVQSIESVPSELSSKVVKTHEEIKKTVHVVEVEKIEKKKKKDIYDSNPKNTPKCILSLADLDLQKKKTKLEEKFTQSPSIHNTAQASSFDESDSSSIKSSTTSDSNQNQENVSRGPSMM